MAVQIPVNTELLSGLIFWGLIVLIKTILMSPITVRYRMKNLVYANPEDKATGGPKAVVKFNDDDVERARRCHLNDIENVFPFVLVGLLYILTGPSVGAALWHFRVFGVSRDYSILHTICYLAPIPQPSRALAFLAGIGVNVSMAVQALMAVC